MKQRKYEAGDRRRTAGTPQEDGSSGGEISGGAPVDEDGAVDREQSQPERGTQESREDAGPDVHRSPP